MRCHCRWGFMALMVTTFLLNMLIFSFLQKHTEKLSPVRKEQHSPLRSHSMAVSKLQQSSDCMRVSANVWFYWKKMTVAHTKPEVTLGWDIQFHQQQQKHQFNDLIQFGSASASSSSHSTLHSRLVNFHVVKWWCSYRSNWIFIAKDDGGESNYNEIFGKFNRIM